MLSYYKIGFDLISLIYLVFFMFFGICFNLIYINEMEYYLYRIWEINKIYIWCLNNGKSFDNWLKKFFVFIFYVLG